MPLIRTHTWAPSVRRPVANHRAALARAHALCFDLSDVTGPHGDLRVLVPTARLSGKGDHRCRLRGGEATLLPGRGPGPRSEKGISRERKQRGGLAQPWLLRGATLQARRGHAREGPGTQSPLQAGSLASELCPQAVPWARLAGGPPEQWTGCIVADDLALIITGKKHFMDISMSCNF